MSLACGQHRCRRHQKMMDELRSLPWIPGSTRRTLGLELVAQEGQDSKGSRDDDAASNFVHKQPVYEAAQNQVPPVEGKGPMHKQRRGHLPSTSSEAGKGTGMSHEPRARPRTRLVRRKVLMLALSCHRDSRGWPGRRSGLQRRTRRRTTCVHRAGSG